MSSHALVFDIETIADLTADNREAIAAMAERRKVTPEDFGALCPPLARIVCIAWYDTETDTMGTLFDSSLHVGEVPATIEVPDGRRQPASLLQACAVEACQNEQQLLQQFGTRIERYLQGPEAQLVTFNGRGFDLPVLVHRSIKHGISAGRGLLIRAANENRYNPRTHIDLMDSVTFMGATQRWPLAAYAIGYGFRSPKQDMDGAQVGAAVAAGRILDVARYCAGDVLATVHVYRAIRGTSGDVSD